MNNQKKLKKYTDSFIKGLLPYLKKGLHISAKIHPANTNGAIIEFEIQEQKRSEIKVLETVPSINTTLERIDQRMIGGNIQGVTFLGTNVYMDGQRIVIIKGEDDFNHWSNSAVTEDINRIVSPKGGSK
ncbi:hypothetical protein BIT28_27775 [Photobacterium proteolyticum]|uniref:Uncharacterized protein n=1 Tax=Photobacterium proteolyticum TaxID=1903952 RepID=A0A1Q9H7A1_9GAMM|nr:hypothetical protein [Photobacterium proteolyticum]OLQ83748.1 hypothetical protein BIT28_27775 [Photobacterium proteolyticum]